MSAWKRPLDAAGGGGGQDSNALYVGDVPDHWRPEEVHELHRGAGLGDGSLQEVKLLPKKLPGETTCAILRYWDAASASRALEALNGVPVETSSGQQKAIRARFADAQQQRGPKAARTGERAAAPALGNGGLSMSQWGAGGGMPPQYPQQQFRALPAMQAPAFGQPAYGQAAYGQAAYGQGACGLSGYGQGMQAGAPQQSTSVYVSEVPAEFTEQQLRAFQSSLGLSGLTEVRFLPQKISGLTASVMLRYASTSAAQQAVLALNGHPVNLSTGAVKHLIAKIAGKQRAAQEEIVAVPAAPQPHARRPAPEEPPAGCDPTSLYLADVPLAMKEDAMRRLHQDSGLEPPSFIKYLPQKLDGETCCAILRYDTEEWAKRAIQVLHSTSVKTRSGKQKFLTARFATHKREGADGAQESGQGYGAYGFDPQPQQAGFALGEESPSQLPSAYVSDLPGEINEDGVRELLGEAGVDPSLLDSVKLLPRKIQANSICAILRCKDMFAVNDIVNVLNGHQVALPGGQTRQLIARIADPPKSSGWAASAPKAAAAPAVHVPTDVYMSEVPVEWTEETVASVHAEAGGDPNTLSSVKVLQRRHAEYPTGAAILRFADNASATAAIALLQGRPVNIPGGQRQLTLRFADPPKKNKR